MFTSYQPKISGNFQDKTSVSSSSHAIVIGSGIAGLLAAQVLTDYFDQITILERDHFPEKPQPRQGVPQSYHPHVLLVQGLLIIEKLFPGIKDELTRQGASSIDWTEDFQWLLMGSWAPRFPSGITSRACTRNLLEATMRQYVIKNQAVRLLEASQVTSLLTNSDNSAITGVRIRNGNKQEIEIPAQLVVDTSGRESKAPKWLYNLGYEVPQETTVKSFLGYSSRWYQIPSSKTLNYKMLYVMPKAPEYPQGGVIHQVENGRLIVNLIGVGRNYPPTDEAGFLDFAKTMESPEMYEAIKDAKPLTPIYGYQRTENRWRHYERLSRLPENFIVLGDAVCAFNPVYGQGITVAALGVLALEQCLKQQQRRSDKTLVGLAKRFQKKLAKVNTIPWLMATGDDFRWPNTEGKRPNFMTRLMQLYIDKVMLVATKNKNAEVQKVLVEVLNLLKPPTALFKPFILVEIIKLALKH